MGRDISGIVLSDPGEVGFNEVREDSWGDYCQVMGMNPSTLVKAIRGHTPEGEMELSMLHLKHAWDDTSQSDSSALLFGRALHCLLFEPGTFESRYCMFDGRRDKRSKDYQAFLAANAGKEVLSADEWARALEAAKSFIREPLVQEIIASGKAEVSVLWTEDVDGTLIQMRGRLDWIATGRSITDLKTAKDISARAFGRDFFRYHYDIKLGLYQRGLSQVTGRHWPVEVICLEKEPPYDITVVPIANSVLEQWAEKGLKILREVKACIDTDTWPGLAKGKEYHLDVPPWEMAEEAVEYDA